MDEPRKGRQTPTQSIVLPYEKTCGNEAIDIYNTTGRTAQEWQELLCYDILAVNDDGLWVHTKAGYSVPRRNGKNEVVVMREMWGLKHDEKILHTAHLNDPPKMVHRSTGQLGQNSLTLSIKKHFWSIGPQVLLSSY